MSDFFLVSSSGGSCLLSGLGDVWWWVVRGTDPAKEADCGGGGCMDSSADIRPESVAEEAVRVASE